MEAILVVLQAVAVLVVEMTPVIAWAMGMLGAVQARKMA
jgi:hypothetical protein